MKIYRDKIITIAVMTSGIVFLNGSLKVYDEVILN